MQSRMSWKFTSHSGHSASNFAGPSSSLVELTDFLSAAQLVKEEDLDALFSHEEMVFVSPFFFVWYHLLSI